MKNRFCAALLVTALSIVTLTGCAAVAAAPASSRPIAKEEAVAIALKDAGFTQDQVTGLRSEFGYDGMQPEYEVEFRQGGYEYDYEIHAETGAILSRDISRED